MNNSSVAKDIDFDFDLELSSFNSTILQTLWLNYSYSYEVRTRITFTSMFAILKFCFLFVLCAVYFTLTNHSPKTLAIPDNCFPNNFHDIGMQWCLFLSHIIVIVCSFFWTHNTIIPHFSNSFFFNIFAFSYENNAMRRVEVEVNFLQYFF